MRAVNRPTPPSAPDPALEVLYRSHQEMILRTAFRLTRNLGDAEDVLHTVFLRLLQRGGPLAGDAGLAPYLHRAAVNAAIEILRRRKPAVPLELLPPSRQAGRESTPDRIERFELAEKLREALARLPSPAAEIFVLRHVEGYSNREIARMLGLSWGSVAVTVHRARRRLQQELQQEWRAKS